MSSRQLPLRYQGLAPYHQRIEISSAPVVISNDADALAAGIASMHGQLDKLVRVRTLGRGIGYGTYPAAPGVWEGGHMVVSLDPKEHFRSEERRVGKECRSPWS